MQHNMYRAAIQVTSCKT